MAIINNDQCSNILKALGLRVSKRGGLCAESYQTFHWTI